MIFILFLNFSFWIGPKDWSPINAISLLRLLIIDMKAKKLKRKRKEKFA
jgi:hypothetical protein